MTRHCDVENNQITICNVTKSDTVDRVEGSNIRILRAGMCCVQRKQQQRSKN